MFTPPSNCDVLVVGAGPAGLAAACTASEQGRRVVLLDDTPWLGGQIWRGEERKPVAPQAQEWLGRLHASRVAVVSEGRLIAQEKLGAYVVETPADSFRIESPRLVLATGARELFLPFPGWTLPGVLGVGGLQTLVKAGWPIAGKTVVISGSGPLLLAAAAGLKRAGARIAAICEQAPLGKLVPFGLRIAASSSKRAQALALRSEVAGIPYHLGWWPVRASGIDQVQSLTITNGRRTRELTCDLAACAFGLVPGLELPALLGCRLQPGDEAVWVDSHQQTSVPGVFAAGELTGVGGCDKALVEGQIAGRAAAGAIDDIPRTLTRERAGWLAFARSLRKTFELRPELLRLAEPTTLVCRCEDVSYERLSAYSTWREAKLQTRCGMGPCQGRICGAATRRLFGWGMESVRPPVLAARVGSLISCSERTPSS